MIKRKNTAKQMGKVFFISAWLLLFITGLNGAEQNPKGTFFDGQIMECSSIVDPRQSNYPDCYFTISVKVNNILKGQLLPQKIKLVVPGFVEYKNTSYANWKTGMMLRAWVIPFDMLEESKRTVQQIDTLDSFDLESFFLIKGEIISELRAYLLIIDFGPV